MADSERDIPPVPAAALNIPSSSSTVEVSIINTTTDIVSSARVLVKPHIPGQDYVNLPTFAFLLRHPASGKKVLFDLGGRKDWWKWTRAFLDYVEGQTPGLRIEKNINEILRAGGVDDQSIDSIVWSHFHWDHIGDASLFPDRTEIVVGPGFKESFMPGYPTRQDSPLLDSDFAGHEVREITFEDGLNFGGFRAFDFFGDGSFYLLDTPGHVPGHISGLARTTADTFIFLGGDICHVPAAWRPTPHLPMPAYVPESVPLDSRLHTPCPCSMFTACHPVQSAKRTTPYYRLANMEGSLYMFPEVAQRSVEAMKAFDADPNILICIAHDSGLLPIMNFFPDGNINDWKAKNLKVAAAWGFLNEMPVEGRPGRPLLVPGLIRDGKTIRRAEEVL